MFNSTARALGATLLTGLAMAATITPAHAGQCPAGQMRENPLAGAATMPANVTDTVLAAIDLGPEIGVDGRQLRTRRLVIQPGGVVPMHSHKDRPALIVTVKGEVTEYRSNCAVPIVHRAGDISREADGISHWWKNTGKTEAVLLSSDVFHGQ
jgi:quercetin dioxygenase-like cupin family protein